MSTAGSADDEHRAFLNRYYGATRLVYDATRKPYLLGRNRALTMLLAEHWTSLVEMGFGTGRNLDWLRARRPDALYGGFDACDAMLEHAKARYPWARLAFGFAESADIREPLGRSPDRVLFSYSLSMIADPDRALERAVEAVAPGGCVVAVDFGPFDGLPPLVAAAMRAWLGRFHVQPLPAEFWLRHGARVTPVAGTYATVATIPKEA